MEFDLTPLRKMPFQILQAKARIAILPILVVGWGIFLYSLEHFVVRGVWSGEVILAVSLEACVLVLITFAWDSTRLPARTVDVGSDALVFAYGSGRARRVAWNAPSFELRLDSTEGVENDPISRGRPVRLVFWSSRRRDFLTEPAFVEIQRQAMAHGIQLQWGVSQRPGWTTTWLRAGGL